ncbi:hypothetical protein BDC45DRAFT_109752 [Circinella umbellata]|nr:hypothetical protein BDC45DRAFT_109752 [Circinella umbellata]
MDSPFSPSSNSSSLSNYLDRATPTSASFPSSTSPTSTTHVGAHSHSTPPVPTRSLSATTLTIRDPPTGGGSQTKRHSLRSSPAPIHQLPRHGSFTGNYNSNGGSSSSSSTNANGNNSNNNILSGIPLDRTMSLQSSNTTTTMTTIYQQRSTSPITSPSIHKSLNALDAKSITLNMEKSSQFMRSEDTMISSPSSPNGTTAGFYFGTNNSNATNNVSSSNSNVGSSSIVGTPYQHHHRHHPSTTSVTGPPGHPYPYVRQGSVSSITVNNNAANAVGGTSASVVAAAAAASVASPSSISNPQGDVWQSLCVRVLPLFNGEGVKGNIEDLNELLRSNATTLI